MNSIFNKSIRFISVLIFLILPLTASYAEHKQKFVVGYAQDNMANDWRAAQIKQLEKEFSKQAVKFVFTDARGSAANQIRNIEDLIYQKVDLLMTSPMDAALMTPVISQIYKNGTPVVLVTRNILTDDFTSFVAPDDKEIAQQAAAFVAGKLKGQGNILILKGVPTATTAIARTEGFLAEIKKYPGIKISAIKVANYLRGEAIQKMDEVIAEKIPYDAIYAQSDSMATGARLAMVKAGIDPASKIIVGIDYIREAHEAIKNGTQTASFLYPTSASQAASIVIKILHNEKVPKHVKVETQIITKDNVDKIKPIF
ncbi:MAG: substrate-binding domain-containing protein [Gammaproteobacteria bacterium]|nr:substrate-binding domain-containing protein [Gammaproteobacteria bacterium]